MVDRLNSTSPTQPPRPWSRRAKLLVSLLVVVHVAAVFVGPWSMPGAASRLALDCGWLLRPYVEALALDNGYRFFAPEPGPSHLLRFEVDGGRVRGEIPNRDELWPRLWYHRHFMLTEFMNVLESAAGPEDSQSRKVAESYAESYARRLALVHRAQTIKLWLVRHRVPTPQDILDGKQLADPEFFDAVELGEFDQDDAGERQP